MHELLVLLHQNRTLTDEEFKVLLTSDQFDSDLATLADSVKLDARKETYQLQSLLSENAAASTTDCDGQPLSGGWLWSNSSIAQRTIRQIQEELLANSTLHSLFDKAAKVRNGVIADDTLAQNYSIRVTDNEGNRLANDRIIVEALNGNQVQMSVEQFSNMSRLEITALLR